MKKLQNVKKQLLLVIRNNKLLTLILVFGFAIRLPGVTHGLPLNFNMDEESFVRSVLGLRFSFSLNRFDWPHTNFFIHYFFYFLFYYFRVGVQFLGMRGLLENFFPLLWNDPAVFYAISRLLTILLGTFTAIPVYLTSLKILKSKKYGLTSALILLLIPYHVYDSTQAVLDTALGFWCAWFFFYCYKIIQKPSKNNYLLAGVFLGLATGTKYNGALYTLPFIVAVFYSANFSKFTLAIKSLISSKYLGYYLKFLIGLICTYLIFNYQDITNFKLFWSDDYGRGLLFQLDNIKSIPWVEYPHSLYSNLITQALGDLGYGFYFSIVLSLAILVFFTPLRTKNNVLFTSFILFVYFFISSKSRSPSHYFVFIFPLLALSITQFLIFAEAFLKNCSEYFKLKKIYSKFLILALYLLVFIPSFVASSLVFIKLVQPDTRNVANEWLNLSADKSLPLYYMGENLEPVPFDDIEEKRVSKLDASQVQIRKTPFYLMIGIPNVGYNDLVVNMRHEKVRGRTSKFLTDSTLELYVNNKYKYGPPIYVFKVNNVLLK